MAATTSIDDEADLQAYLGDDYDRSRLEQYERQLDEELEEIGDEQTLYRTSQAYLYNLTAFAMTGTKDPYREMLRRHVPAGAHLLDFGCGIGADGLRLLAQGYRVTFADFDNPSTRFLRWRLERHGFEAEVLDLERTPLPEDAFDLAYSFDVLEHLEDPEGAMERLHRAARLVLVNLLDPEPGETDLHHELPVGRMLRAAAAREPFAYELHHGRSHVVLAGRGRARLPVRAARVLRLARKAA